MPKNFNKSESKGLKEEMIKACKKAAEFYNLRLLKDKEPETTHVIEYLTGRGITKDIIEKFTLGVAPKAYAMFYKKIPQRIFRRSYGKSRADCKIPGR